MENRILWIEDDYHAIKGLVRPLEKSDFQVDVATSALMGFQKARDWQKYDLIVVDLIQPLSNGGGYIPEEVRSWDKEDYTGIGLVKWLMSDLDVDCPVAILSVVRDPIATYGLEHLGLAGYLPKRGLLPSRVKEWVFEILGLDA